MEQHPVVARALPLPFTSLNWLLLVLCIVIIVVISFVLFYWNRLFAWFVAWLLRVFFWRKSNVWIEIEGLQFSLLAGRVFIKDLQYHSRNISLRILKCHITWRYWLWKTQVSTYGQRDEHAEGEAFLKTGRHLDLPCRIHAGLEGVELFLYNRTPAYDEIIRQLGEDNDVFGQPNDTTNGARGFSLDDPVVDKNTRATVITHSTARPRGAMASLESFSRGLKAAGDWIKGLVPTFNITDVLPLSFDAAQCAIVAGNDSTPSVLIGEVIKLNGTYGLTNSRSKLDLYKDVYSLKLSSVKVITRTNPDYQNSLVERGEMIFADLAPRLPDEELYQYRFLRFDAFRRIVKLHGMLIRKLTPKPPPKWKGLPRYLNDSQRRAVGELPYDVEYAKVTSLLETPLLEVLYTVDVPGPVPDDPRHLGGAGEELIDVGNGDLAPEWCVELLLHGGSITYGPWADRQRDALQKIFFPSTYENRSATVRVSPGDARVHTAFVLRLEVKDKVVLRLPTREGSKDWNWDGRPSPADTRKPKDKRPFGWFDINLAPGTTLNYIMSMVSDDLGFRNSLEVHMKQPELLSSVNGLSFWRNESCRILADLPAPLHWNAPRQWTFDISFGGPLIHLLRDHTILITDLINDWISGPPSDFRTFVPTNYLLKFGFKSYNLWLYTNDHNIIDHPLSDKQNSLLLVSGPSIVLELLVRSDKFRPFHRTTSFWAEAPRMDVAMSLPDWNTYQTFAKHHPIPLGSVGFLRLDAAYTSYAEVHPDNIDKLSLDIKAREVGFICHSWSIRHFLRLKDNYFGRFTHFDVAQDYLKKKSSPEGVGDPVEKKYRPGHSNAFEVTLTLNVLDNRVVLPRHIHSAESGAGIVCPELQVYLRLHDWFLELSLNLAPITVLAVPATDTFLQNGAPRPIKGGRIELTGLDIAAHRLFGPQPLTATYVCIWEIRLGVLRGVLMPRLLLLLREAVAVLGFNYGDPFNAPDATFELPLDPDVTFLKVTLPGVDLTLKDANSSVNVSLPSGLLLDFNDLPGQTYAKVMSIRLPLCQVRNLLRSPYKRDHWFEVAWVRFDCFTDIYSAPPGWQEHANRQMKFLTEQDAPTRRLRFLYEKERDHGTRTTREAYLPALFLSPVKQHSRQSGRRPSAPARAVPEPQSEDSGSGSDVLTEHERRARVTGSRPIHLTASQTFSASPESGSGMSSADESDDGARSASPPSSSETDLSDQLSDSSDSPRWPKFEHYHHILNRYRLSTQDLNDSPVFVLARDPIDVLQWGPTGPNTDDESGAPPPNADFAQALSQATRIIRLRSQRSFEAFASPLIVTATRSLYASFERCVTPLESRLDALLVEYLSSVTSTISSTTTVIDFALTRIKLSILQRVEAAENSKPTAGTPTQLLTAANLQFKGLSLLASLSAYADTSAQPRQNAWLNVQSMGLHVHTATSHPRSKHFVPVTLLSAYAKTLEVSVKNSDKLGGSVQFGGLHAFLGPQTPKPLSATFKSSVRFISKLAATAQRASIREVRRRQHMVYTLMQHSPEKSVWADPLSWTQASFIVKDGLPAKLRADLSWKIIAHMRHRLLDLNLNTSNALADRLDGIGSDTAAPPRDFLEGLMSGQEWLDWTFDAGDQSPALMDLLYPSPSGQARVAITSGQITFSFGPSTVNVTDGSIVGGVFTFGPILGSFQKSLRRLDGAAAHTSDKEAVIHLLVSLDVHDFGINILPTFIPFVSEVLRLQSQPGPRRSVAPKIPMKNPLLLELTLDVQRARFEASALKLVLEVETFGVHASASASIRSAEMGEITLETSLSLMTDQFRVGSKATPLGSKSIADQDKLAEIILDNSALNVMLKEAPTERNIGIVLGQDSIDIAVPRSALKLYDFMTEWRVEYMSKYETMVNELFAEIERTPPAASAPALPRQPKKCKYTLHTYLKRSNVVLQVMHTTAVRWTMEKAAFFFDGQSLSPVMGRVNIDLETQEITVHATTNEGKRGGVSTAHTRDIRLPLPRFTGEVALSQKERKFTTRLGYFHFDIIPRHVDDILTVQQKFGTDFADLLNLYSVKQDVREQPKLASDPVSLEGTIYLSGFAIGLRGPSSTQYLSSGEISGSVASAPNAQLAWHADFTSVALSLAHHSIPKSSRQGFDRRFRSAYMEFALFVHNGSPGDSIEHLSVSMSKIHAVMQAAAFSELGDLADYIRAEMRLRREQKAEELEAILEKGRLIRHKLELEPTTDSANNSFWANRRMEVNVQSIGVAFPLSAGEDVMPTHSAQRPVTPFAPSSVRAFLFSVESVGFVMQGEDKNTLSVKNISFQFVGAFDQSNMHHFDGGHHPSVNRLVLPSVDGSLTRHKEHDAGSGSITNMSVDGDVNGFNLDLDASIATDILSLVNVYRQGKERIERLAPGQARANLEALHARIASSEEVASRLQAASSTRIKADLTFRNGRIQLFRPEIESHPSGHRIARESSGFGPVPLTDDTRGDGRADIILLPALGVMVTFVGSPKHATEEDSDAQDPSSPSHARSRSRQPALDIRTRIDKSENIIRPTVLPFFSELLRHVESHMRESAERYAATPLPTPMPTTPSVEQGLGILPAAADAIREHLGVEFELVIQESTIIMSCQPDANVAAELKLGATRINANISSESHHVNVATRIQSVKATLKHEYLQVTAVEAGANDVVLTVQHAPHKQGSTRPLLSMTLFLDVKGVVKFARLQDVLCFKAVWLDRIPVLDMRTRPGFPESPSAPPMVVQNSAGQVNQVTPMSITAAFRTVDLTVDLGRHITLLNCTLTNLVFTLDQRPEGALLKVLLSMIDIRATHTLTGHLTMPNFSFTTQRQTLKRDSTFNELKIIIETGKLDALLQDERKDVLEFQVTEISTTVWDSLPEGASSNQNLHLDFELHCGDILGVTRHTAPAQLIVTASKIKNLVNEQKRRAAAESRAFATTLHPQSANPLSEVAATMLVSRFPDVEQYDFSVVQRMKVAIASLKIGLQHEVSMLTAQAEDIAGSLQRTVWTDRKEASRDLILALGMFSVQSRPAATNLKTTVGNPKTLFMSPRLNIRMTSTLFENPPILRYEFESTFPQESGKRRAQLDLALDIAAYRGLYAGWHDLADSISKALKESGFPDVSESLQLEPPASSSMILESVTGSEEPLHSSPVQETPLDLPSEDLLYEPARTTIESPPYKLFDEEMVNQFFSRFTNINVKSDLPQWVHQYATVPIETAMKLLLSVYAQRLRKAHDATRQNSLLSSGQDPMTSRRASSSFNRLTL